MTDSRAQDLVRRLERVRGVAQGGSTFGAGPGSFQTSDPQRLAKKVLAHCSAELGLPQGMGIWWDHLPSTWGVVNPAHPTVLRLNKRLLTDPRQLVDTVAHECLHAQRILNGNTVYDAEAETAARDYGRRIAARWSYL